MAQLVAILGLAYVSGYRVPDLEGASWDTVLFLTPFGIIKNFLAESPVMKSFYSDVSAGQIVFMPLQIIFVNVLILFSFFNFYRLAVLVKK